VDVIVICASVSSKANITGLPRLSVAGLVWRETLQKTAGSSCQSAAGQEAKSGIRRLASFLLFRGVKPAHHARRLARDGRRRTPT